MADSGLSGASGKTMGNDRLRRNGRRNGVKIEDILHWLMKYIFTWVRRIVFCAYLRCRDVACRVSPGGNSWNCHIHLMRCAARQPGGETNPGTLTTNPFHIVYKLQEGRRKVCSTTWNSYSTTWNGCFSTWNSYFTSWNAKVYNILLVLFLLSCALANKQKFVELTISSVFTRSQL